MAGWSCPSHVSTTTEFVTTAPYSALEYWSDTWISHHMRLLGLLANSRLMLVDYDNEKVM